MLVSRGRNPSAGEILTQLIQAKDLRNRVLITLGLLLLVRMGIYIPVPGIDRVAFQDFIARGGQLIGFLDIFTGGGISTLGVFGLGILPYINASIILQLLTSAIPQLEDLQKNEGEAGRRKIAQYTRYVALGWGILQSIVFALILRPYATAGTSDLVFVAQTAVALVTGSMIVMWISEVITERGIGQGASLVIYLNIVATLPRALGSTIELAQSGDRSTVGGIVVLVAVFLLTIVGIVCVEEGNRRIPIVSAKRQVGGVSLSSRQSYLPLKLNAGGVMPIIFASAVVFLPLTIANLTKSPWLINVAAVLSPNSGTPWVYALLFFSLIIGFSFFYATLTINPADVATNLKWILHSNSLCLMPKPRFETWFLESRLIAGVHYVQLEEDYSNLIAVYEHYEKNPQDALTIIGHAQAYTQSFLDSAQEQLLAKHVCKADFDAQKG